ARGGRRAALPRPRRAGGAGRARPRREPDDPWTATGMAVGLRASTPLRPAPPATRRLAGGSPEGGSPRRRRRAGGSGGAVRAAARDTDVVARARRTRLRVLDRRDRGAARVGAAAVLPAHTARRRDASRAAAGPRGAGRRPGDRRVGRRSIAQEPDGERRGDRAGSD